MGIILAVIAIFLFVLLIVFHEFGHFVTAKLADVQVNEFAIGMGPVIFKRQKGDTLYSLRLLPIGGYCAMEGENEESINARAFVNKPAWKKIIIVAAGAIMNFVLAIIFMMLTLIPQENFASTTVAKFVDGAVTEQYGLQVGDVIKSIDGYTVHSYTDIAFSLALNNNFSADIVVNRNGRTVELKGVQFKTVQNDDGTKMLARDFYVKAIPKTFITFFSQTFKEIVSNVRVVYVSLFKLITGQLGFNAVSGPVGMASVIASAASSGLQINFFQALMNILTVMMALSVSFGVMNLLPFPALDGGRLVFLVVEAITKKRINQKYEEIVHKAGFVLLMLLAVAVFFNDVYKLFGGFRT